MIHNECGKEYNVRPGSFLRGSRCPYCHVSRGERAIRDFLNLHSIEFKQEFSDKDCVHVGRLKFDFAIFKNDKLELLIEFDGIQHFEPVDTFGGEEEFKETQIRDNIKNEFCKKNNIPLLRIPYWELENIDNIVCSKLKELNLIKN